MALTCSASVTGRLAAEQVRAGRVFSGALPPRRALRVVVNAQAPDLRADAGKLAAWTTATATFLAAGNAQAAQEITQIAAGDNRTAILAALALPALGWVAFNIGGPALSQLDSMKRSVAVGLGLTAATMIAAQSADAAQEVVQLAAGDNRLTIIATLFLPVVGWVLFNIGGPALNQLQSTANKSKPVAKAKSAIKKKRGVVAGLVGMGAASLLTAQADAADEVMQLAAGDNRFSIIAVLFFPVIAWVLFNIGGPALNQLSQTGVAKNAKGPARGARR